MTEAGSSGRALRAASVGLGWWSDELAKSVAGSTAIEIVACCSRSPEKRKSFQERFGARPIESYEQVLADPEIDAVILTTPHSMHGEHVRMAAGAGKHVFVEKPFTLEADDAMQAADACRAAGIVLAVGHNRRFAPGANWLKQILNDGSIGSLLHIEANFSTSSAMAYTEDRWRASRVESPGGAIAGCGIHMIDLMCWLAGPVQRVNAQAIRQALPVDIDDTTSAIIRFESGPTGYLGTCFACPYTTFITVYGTEAIAHVDPDANTGWLKPAGGSPEPQRFDPLNTLRTELEEFAAACVGGAPFRVGTSEAIHNVAVMQAMVISAASDGAPVDPRALESRS